MRLRVDENEKKGNFRVDRANVCMRSSMPFNWYTSRKESETETRWVGEKYQLQAWNARQWSGVSSTAKTVIFHRRAVMCVRKWAKALMKFIVALCKHWRGKANVNQDSRDDFSWLIGLALIVSLRYLISDWQTESARNCFDDFIEISDFPPRCHSNHFITLSSRLYMCVRLV